MLAAQRSQAPSALGQDFYDRPALRVARGLLGKVLVRDLPSGRQYAVIHEVEAYVGPHDLACHAAKGRTLRTEVMFGPAGYWYVYFIYGVHWMLNIVTERDGYPAAVLIRGAGLWNGPAKLTKALSIDKAFNGQLAMPAGAKRPRSEANSGGQTHAGGQNYASGQTHAGGLWIEDRTWQLSRGSIARTPRIGVDYAGTWAAKPYRFVLSAAVAQELQQIAALGPS